MNYTILYRSFILICIFNRVMRCNSYCFINAVIYAFKLNSIKSHVVQNKTDCCILNWLHQLIMSTTVWSILKVQLSWSLHRDFFQFFVNMKCTSYKKFNCTSFACPSASSWMQHSPFVFREGVYLIFETGVHAITGVRERVEPMGVVCATLLSGVAHGLAPAQSWRLFSQHLLILSTK